MTLEGELRVRLDWNGASVTRVRVASTRRDAAARLLAGRTPEEALAWLPRAFSICATAQRVAAQLALQGAGAPVSIAADARAVAREIVDEYFFRLLIDWPRAAGEDVEAAAVGEVRRTSFDRLPALAAQHVFGEPPATFLARRDLDAWTASGATLPARLLAALLRDSPCLGRSDVALMPHPSRESLESNVLAGIARNPGYASAPIWNGEPVETGALARMRAHPLVAAVVTRDGHTAAARMTARLVELAFLLEPGASAFADGFASRPHEGAGAVQTARGLLVHRARVEDGRIVDYRIVAPTEWNFHPDGALVRGLHGLAASEMGEIERRAGVAVQALDPCVACSIEVAHA
jgi:coenzyme F420-reducing hydrogenase alpha subunit